MKSHNVEITLALIALVSALGTALITNWEKFFPLENPVEKQAPSVVESLPSQKSEPVKFVDSQISPVTDNDQKHVSTELKASAACVSFSRDILTSVEIRNGTCFTDSHGSYRAAIKLVTRNAVSFLNFNGKEITCSLGDTCNFGWPDAPSFHVIFRNGSDHVASIVIAE